MLRVRTVPQLNRYSPGSRGDKTAIEVIKGERHE